MRDHRATVIMASNKVLEDCPILLAKCEAVRQTIIITIEINSPRICIHNNSQLVVNAIKSKIAVPKEITNLAEKIKSLMLYFKRTRIEYYS